MIEKITDYFREQQTVIAISGKSGCGNTTLGSMLAHTLNIRLVNYTFRTLAVERGLSFDEVVEEAATNDEVDRHIDRRQLELASAESSVIASRLAIWLKNDAILKVYLQADFDLRVKRIQSREGWTAEKARVHTEKRDLEDHQRYLRIYGINNDDYSFADLVLDSGSQTPEQLQVRIIQQIKEICRRAGRLL